MKRTIVCLCLVLCGCRGAQPDSHKVRTSCETCPPQSTEVKLRCNCWLHREVTGAAGCPCDSDCTCKPKAKCGCDCHCGEPKK